MLNISKFKYLKSSFYLLILLFLAIFCLSLTSCSYLLKPKNSKVKISEVKLALSKATEKDYEEIVSVASDSLFYGEGLGEAAINVGATVAFPPYAIYLLGNTVLDLAGYEKVGVSTFLSNESKQKWKKAYSGVVGIPGSITAVVSSKEFVDRDATEDKIVKIINRINQRGLKYAQYDKNSYQEAEKLYYTR